MREKKKEPAFRWMTEEQREREFVIVARNAEAEAAYDAAMPRLSVRHPDWVAYREGLARAMAAYDAVIVKWRPRLWKDKR